MMGIYVEGTPIMGKELDFSVSISAAEGVVLYARCTLD